MTAVKDGAYVDGVRFFIDHARQFFVIEDTKDPSAKAIEIPFSKTNDLSPVLQQWHLTFRAMERAQLVEAKVDQNSKT